MYVATTIRGLTSETRVTIPRTVTNFPTESARTSRITRGLLLLGPWKYNSLREGNICQQGLGEQAPSLTHKDTHNLRMSSEGYWF